MSRRQILPSQAECLVEWPKGSVGHYSECEAVRKLVELCNDHGYGRISQLASQIEDLWRDPSKEAKTREARDRRQEMMKKARDGDPEALAWVSEFIEGFDQEHGVGDVMTMEEFSEHVRSGAIMDDDGFGYLSDGRKHNSVRAEANEDWVERHEGAASHVVWYNS